MVSAAGVADVVDAANIGVGEASLRVAVAALLGGLIGLEREYAGREAGVRTHALLALGAALFAVVSVGGFGPFAATSADTNVRVDVTRVASYVAAAVGFIGGGVIVKGQGGVRGLTTAATLWVTCATGLACGVGLLGLAAVVAGCALATLLFERPMRAVRRRLGIAGANVSFVAPAGTRPDEVSALVEHLRELGARDLRITSGGSDDQLRVRAKVDPAHLLDLTEVAHAAGLRIRYDADVPDRFSPPGPATSG